VVLSEELELQEITTNIYAIVGSLDNRTPDNLGNNATFGFVVTTEGVVLIDAGGTYKGAQKIHEVIQRVTDKPIVKIINTGGQDHRWLGNSYFKRLGAEIIASEKAVKDQKARLNDQLYGLGILVGSTGLDGTSDVYADRTFAKSLSFVIGDFAFEIHHAGQAHTPGDSFVWLPKQRVMFTGDIVYTERMLGILDHSNSKRWMETFEVMASYDSQYMVPGHGHPTTSEKAKSDTYEYLKFVRQSVAEFIESGGDISEISKIDQSKFNYLLNYDLLSGRNAQRVYSELEWE
jgi:glyoxylase-like metal-dependent hydrolase (beta-lactamase superfamily II)